MKKTNYLIPLYSFTLFLSAALLFSVQPMFSKMILPLLGGTPQVWNTAMLFFQVMLLGGYAYAHGTTKHCSVRLQALLHMALLVFFFFILPFGIPAGWTPPKESDPALWQLSLMAITVGGPFFVLSATAPMLQRWFSGSGHVHAENPYFLYGASNLGSIAALLAYPMLVEPFLTLPGQAYIWMAGYAVLTGFIMVAASLALSHKAQSRETVLKQAKDSGPASWRRRALWILLAFIPSSLMLGVTTYITTDIAAIPLLWIVPLALYVLTFVIVFARRPFFNGKSLSKAQGIFMILLVGLMILTSVA